MKSTSTKQDRKQIKKLKKKILTNIGEPLPTSVSTERYGRRGEWEVYEFDNGFGASLVKHQGSYGYEDGLWELAVLHNGGICYCSGITTDVIGYLTKSKAKNIIRKVRDLKKKKKCGK